MGGVCIRYIGENSFAELGKFYTFMSQPIQLREKISHIFDQVEVHILNIPMENGDRIGVNVVLEPQNNTGDSTNTDDDKTDDTNQNTDPDTGGDSGRDSDCPPNCIIGEDVEDASNEESSLIGPKSLLVVIVILLLLAVGILTRATEEEKEEEVGVDQTVIIEKEWQDEKKQFVPELPPLAPPPSMEEE